MAAFTNHWVHFLRHWREKTHARSLSVSLRHKRNAQRTQKWFTRSHPDNHRFRANEAKYSTRAYPVASSRCGQNFTCVFLYHKMYIFRIFPTYRFFLFLAVQSRGSNWWKIKRKIMGSPIILKRYLMINLHGVKSEKYLSSPGMAIFGFMIQNASKKSITSSVHMQTFSSYRQFNGKWRHIIWRHNALKWSVTPIFYFKNLKFRL